MDKKRLDAEALKQVLLAHEVEGKHLLIGFSGGRDSSVLLTLLAALREELSLRLSACHVHHGIRGESADRDAAFCKTRCAALNIPFYLEKIDLPALARKQGKGLEECGREERYRILRQYADRLQADAIVTAHHADDQLETILLHLTRGSGLRGLCGMESERDGIFRPLLGFSEEEIEAYRVRENIPYTEDESNADLRYSRNALRHEVLPVLRSINPAVSDAAGRTVTLLRRDEDFLASLSEQADALPDEVLREQPLPILTRVLDRRYRAYTGLPGLPFGATERLTELYRAGEGKLSLPGGVYGICEKGRLYFLPDQRGAAGSTDIQPIKPGETVFFHGYSVSCEKKEAKEKKIPASGQNVHTIFMKEGYADGVPFLRGWTAGDRIFCGGRLRKASELLRAAGVTGVRRQRYPILCDGARLLAIPGIAVADGCTASEHENYIRLIFQTAEGERA